jgi:hypothetical protein
MPTLEQVVRDLGLAAARARGFRYLLRALVGAAAWAGLVMAFAHLAPIEGAPLVASAGLPLALLGAAVLWAVRRPGPMVLARVADARLDLRQRLATAWERRDSTSAIDLRQRRDALEQAAPLALAAAFPVRLRRGEVSVLAAIAVAALAVSLLPNPMDRVIAQRHADQRSQSLAAATLRRTADQAAARRPAAGVDPQVQRTLRDAAARISRARDPRQALETITPAEQRLAQLSDPATGAQAADAQSLADALSSTAAGRAAGQALSSSPAAGAQGLRDLAGRLQDILPADRAELARALSRAAQQTHDPAARQSLQDASSSLAAGDTTAAASALNQTASRLSALDRAVANDNEIASAINGLEAARSELARQADRDAAAGQGGPGGRGAGAGQSPGASPSAGGSASGSGNGKGAAGAGQGNGTGTGSGNRNGTGNGGSGGRGASGSGSGSGSGSRQSTERIYVPGQPVPGHSEDAPTPLGPGQDVPMSPYTQVIPAYEKAALDVIDHSAVPGSEKDLVRRYFSSLGEGGS